MLTREKQYLLGEYILKIIIIFYNSKNIFMYIISFEIQVRQETDKEMLLSHWQRGTKVKGGPP